MQFINKTSSSVLIPVKVEQTRDTPSGTSWIKFKPGDIKSVPERAIKTAKLHGLIEATEKEIEAQAEYKVEAQESSIGNTAVETKQVKNDLDDLININGIGKETVDDIKNIYKDVDTLKEALGKGTAGLRNDVVDKLKEFFEVE